MPTFELTGPDGGTYQVDAPDAQAAVNALSPQSAAPKVGISEDLAKSAASIPGRVVGGTLGIPGDLLHLGLRALGDNLSPESNYGSQAITKSLGSDYEAQRLPGQLAQKAGDFLPAVIGGPETLGVKLATRVAAPAIGSEIGDAVGGPIGSVAGALAGGVAGVSAANKFKQMAAARQAANATPTADQLYKAADSGFNDARNMNVVVKPDFATNAANDMRSSIKSYDPALVSGVHGAADRLEAMAGKAGNTAVELNDVENIRKQLVSLKTSPDASIRSAAKDAIESLQKSQMGITAADTLAGDAGAYTKTIKDAVGNWAAMKRSNAVTGKIDLANLNAGTAGSGANIDNNLRQAFKQLARPINNTNTPVWKKLGFSNQEGAAIEQAATGTMVGNAARYLGKAAPTGIVSATMSGGAGHMVGGPVGAVALPVAGYIAKKIGDLSTKRAVAAVDSLVRSRSPLAAQVVQHLPPQLIQMLPAKSARTLTALIAADRIAAQTAAPVNAGGN